MLTKKIKNQRMKKTTSINKLKNKISKFLSKYQVKVMHKTNNKLSNNNKVENKVKVVKVNKVSKTMNKNK